MMKTMLVGTSERVMNTNISELGMEQRAVAWLEHPAVRAGQPDQVRGCGTDRVTMIEAVEIKI